jgi:hypothetical protein
MAGAVLAITLYKLIKAMEYESANPDPGLGPALQAASESVPSMRTLTDQQREIRERKIAMSGGIV